jgi:hypothetical protein
MTGTNFMAGELDLGALIALADMATASRADWIHETPFVGRPTLQLPSQIGFRHAFAV